MSKVGSWSTTPGNNNSTPPDGWPEGQAPSTVNDCGRQMMADIRTMISDLQYLDFNNTPSYLTASSFSLGAADTTNFVVGRRVKCFDAETLYGTINSVSGTTVHVRLDAGALTASLSSVAVGVVTPNNDSLPESVWNHDNIIINGAMDIWQRSDAAVTGNAIRARAADCFSFIQSMSTGAANMVRSERSATATNVPTIAQAGVWLNNALAISVSAAAGVAADGFAMLEYAVEGYDYRNVAHRPAMLDFMMLTNATGTYAVSVRNGGASASFLQNLTLSAADTWTRFSITIPEAPTSYTWDYSSGVGLRISWVLAAGTNYQGGAGNWTSGVVLASASQRNFFATAGNVMKITGVRLHPGTSRLPMKLRHYQEDLARAQRYCQRFIVPAALRSQTGYGGAESMWTFGLTTQMRAVPDISVSAVVATTNVKNGLIAYTSTINSFSIAVSGSAAGASAILSFSSTTAIVLKSELL